MHHFVITARLLPLLGLAALTAPALAGKFPPITDEERALIQVLWEPDAPAVVLFKDAELRIHSELTVRQRIKILTEKGKEYGEVEIPHDLSLQLADFRGRTVLPFVRRDEVEMTLSWPPGWEIDAVPAATFYEGGAAVRSPSCKSTTPTAA